MGGARLSLSGDELRKRAAQVADWKVVENHHLSKTFLFPDFKSALDFVNRVGAVAEEQGHHPDLHLTWGRVDVTTWSHDADGLTERDFTLAGKIDQQFFKR